MAVAKEISEEAAAAAVSSKPDGVFHMKRRTSTRHRSLFWVDDIFWCFSRSSVKRRGARRLAPTRGARLMSRSNKSERFTLTWSLPNFCLPFLNDFNGLFTTWIRELTRLFCSGCPYNIEILQKVIFNSSLKFWSFARTNETVLIYNLTCFHAKKNQPPLLKDRCTKISVAMQMAFLFLFLPSSSDLCITLTQPSHHSHFLLTCHHPVGVSPHDLHSTRPCPHVWLSLSKPFNRSRTEFILCQRSDCGCGASLHIKHEDTHVHLKGSWVAQPPPSHLLRPHCLIKTDLSGGAADDRRKRQRCIIRALLRLHPPQAAYLAPVWWDLSNNGSRLQSLFLPLCICGQNPELCCSLRMEKTTLSIYFPFSLTRFIVITLTHLSCRY